MSSAYTLYGLIGYPLKHSLSPAMHNAAFKALGINAEYRLFEIKPEGLDSFLETLDDRNISGLNITVPYKEKVLDFVQLDDESFYLRQVGAVNTIVKKNGRWKGFNTDIAGFAQHLKEQYNPLGKSAALLGAGGAGRAIVYVLAQSKVKELVIFDIEKTKAEAVVSMIEELFPHCRVSAVATIEQLHISEKDLLINATPVGLNESDSPLVRQEMLHKNLFVYDLIYNPAETRLLALAKKVGAKTSNGLGMLLYQGVLSFKYFTGKDAPVEVMRKALLDALGEGC